MNLEGIKVIVGANIDELNSKLDKAEGRLKGFGGISEKIGSAGAKALGAIATALGAVATAVGVVGVQYNALMETSQIAWATILQDEKKAVDMLAKLQDMGAKTPFEFAELDKSAKLLQMAGYEGDNLFKTLTAVGDAVSAIGGSGEELEGVSMAIFQMATKGKISAEEMNQLAERGIPAWEIMAKKMGMTIPELMKMSENGKLFAKDVLPMLTEGLGERFGGAMDKMSTTFTGRLSTMKDSFKMLSAELAKPIFEVLKAGMATLQPLLDSVLNLLQGKTSGADFLKSLGLSPEAVTFILEAVAGIKAVAQEFATWWVTTTKALFSGEGNLGTTFINIFNTIKSIAMPLLQNIGAFIKSVLDEIRAFWKEHGDTIIQAVQNFWQVVSAIFNALAPVILWVIEQVWGSIKGVIHGAIKVIMGIIEIFSAVFTGDWSALWDGILDLLGGAVELIWNLLNLLFIGKILTAIKNFGKNLVTNVAEFGVNLVKTFKTTWDNMWQWVDDFAKNTVATFKYFKDLGFSIFQSIKGTLEVIWQGLIQALTRATTSLKTGLEGTFNAIWSVAKSIFNGVKNAITNPIESAKTIILGIIDTIKSAFANMIIKIPKPKLPKVSVTMKTGIAGIPYPDFDVSWFKKGGLFNGASIIGVGEAGPEAVVPLQGHRMKPFAETIAKQMPNSGAGGGLTVQVAQLIVREEADIKRIAYELYGLQQRTLRQGGRG